MPPANSTDLEGLLQVDATSTRAVRVSVWKKAALIVAGAVGLATGCAAAGWHAHKAYISRGSVEDATQLQSADWNSVYTGYTQQLTSQWEAYEKSQTSSQTSSSKSSSSQSSPSPPSYSISDFTDTLQKQIGAAQSMSASATNSMSKMMGHKGLDPEKQDCRTENLQYNPMDNIPGEMATTELLDTLCMLRCANTTGCTYWTFFPGSLMNCHIMNEYVSTMTVMSVGDVPGPISGRVCSAKELAKKAAKEVIKTITANLTEAYEMCEEEGVSYSPMFTMRGLVSNSSACRAMCKDNSPKCHQWTYRAMGRSCELSTNSSFLMTSKGMHGVVSAKRSCDEAAEEQAEKKKEAEERKSHRPKLFGPRR